MRSSSPFNSTEDVSIESIEIDSSKAEKLYERVFNQYGDDSVAQLGVAHLACEQASNLERYQQAFHLSQIKL